MLLLSPIVTNLQWNEQYKFIYAIFSGNFGIPNKNTVNLLDCKPP